MGESASAERQRRHRAENPTPKWHKLFISLLVAIKTTMDEDNLSDEVSTLVIAADTADLVAKYPLTELELRVPKSQPTEAEKLAAQAAKTAERAKKTAEKVAEKAKKAAEKEAAKAAKHAAKRDGPAATGKPKTAKKKPGRPAGAKTKQKPVNVTVDHQPTTVKIPWSNAGKTQEEIDAHLATV
jgi:hypothetical protein